MSTLLYETERGESVNDRYYELVRDRDLINKFIDKRKHELGGKPLTHEMMIRIQNEFLEQCRIESQNFEEQDSEQTNG
jgi:hypothetical protein